MSDRRPRSPSGPTPPAGLVVSRVGTSRDQLAIFSFPLAAEACALTRAESEVARALIEGKSNDAIARARGTSVRTVANQVASVYRKLGVQSRAELVATSALVAASGR